MVPYGSWYCLWLLELFAAVFFTSSNTDWAQTTEPWRKWTVVETFEHFLLHEPQLQKPLIPQRTRRKTGPDRGWICQIHFTLVHFPVSLRSCHGNLFFISWTIKQEEDAVLQSYTRRSSQATDDVVTTHWDFFLLLQKTVELGRSPHMNRWLFKY